MSSLEPNPARQRPNPESWLRERLDGIAKEQADEYVRVLTQGLPGSSRTNIEVSSQGNVSGEVSHGLTSDNTRAAAKAALKKSSEALDKLIEDFDKTFG